MKTILCYGDSNTWGFVPCADSYQSGAAKRYSREIRWTGRLQNLLGQQYCVVEEGLNGRTTNINYQVPPDRNGATYLPPCLYSHAPIDLVIFALGGNDFKSYFNRQPVDICAGMAALIDIVQASRYGCDMQSPPQILLLSQPIPLPVAEQYKDDAGNQVFKNLIDNARALVPLYESLAKERNCYFMDMSNDIHPSAFDGVHLDERAHKIYAERVFEKLGQIFA